MTGKVVLKSFSQMKVTPKVGMQACFIKENGWKEIVNIVEENNDEPDNYFVNIENTPSIPVHQLYGLFVEYEEEGKTKYQPLIDTQWKFAFDNDLPKTGQPIRFKINP